MQLKDKVAIVTGASSGIGRAAAKRFAAEGARVVVTARRAHMLETLVAEISDAGGHAFAVSGDVRDAAHAEAAVRAAIDEYGGLDIAFNNAGVTGPARAVHELSLDEWRETIDVNLTAAFLAARYQVPAMLGRGGGSLIFTSSFVGNTAGFPGMAAYAAAKAGLCGFAQTLAVEFGASGIRANALLPGGVDTPANHANAPGAGPEVRGFVEGLHALKRLATPDEIADVAVFLASSASSFVTGTAMLADGGVSISRT